MEPTGLYSRFIWWSKVLLPLLAVAILSVIFLLARSPADISGVPYSDLKEIARDERINAPRTTGVTDNGAIVTTNARSAHPNDGGGVLTYQVDGQMVSANGIVTNMFAQEGTLNSNQILRLTGLVHVETSDGYQFETQALTSDLSIARLITDAEVEGRAPFGTLTAGQMVIETPDGDESQIITFQNGVHLLYQPKKE